MLSEEIGLIEYISGISFEFGILAKDERTLVKAFSLDANGKPVESEMAARDAMYLAEYGTFYIPGRFLLQGCISGAKKIIERDFVDLVGEIFKGGKSAGYVKTKARETALRIRDYARDRIAHSDPSVLSRLQLNGIDSSLKTPVACDLQDLARRIDCSAIFRN